MKRMIDEMSDLRPADPQAWIYNYGRPSPEKASPKLIPHATPVLASFREQAAGAVRVAADGPAAYLYSTPDREWQPEEFPNLTQEAPALWLDFAKPQEKPAGEELGRLLPRRWGWLFHRANKETAATILRRHAVEPSHVMHEGLVGRLAVADGKMAVYPTMSVVIQLDRFGQSVGFSPTGFSVDVDRDRIHDLDALAKLGRVLLRPALFTLCCLNSPLVQLTPVQGSPAVRTKKHKNRRPLAGYSLIKVGAIVERLRMDGHAGLQGLPAALQTCRAVFRS